MGNTALVFVRVLDIVELSEKEAYARFPVEADACDLKTLIAEWNGTSVQCIVLDKLSIRLVTDLVHLAKGGLGCVHQFACESGEPHFCHRRDLGKLVRVTLDCHGGTMIVTRSLAVTWPESTSGARPGDSTSTTAGGSAGHKKKSPGGKIDEDDDGEGKEDGDREDGEDDGEDDGEGGEGGEGGEDDGEGGENDGEDDGEGGEKDGEDDGEGGEEDDGEDDGEGSGGDGEGGEEGGKDDDGEGGGLVCH
jgi:hypothetical protein